MRQKGVMEKWKLSLKLGDLVWFVITRREGREVQRGKLVPPDLGDHWVFTLYKVPGVSKDLPWCVSLRGDGPYVLIKVEEGCTYRIPADCLMQTEANAYKRVLAEKRKDVASRAENLKVAKTYFRQTEIRYKMALDDMGRIQKKLQIVKQKSAKKSLGKRRA